MGDVAQILGQTGASASASTVDATASHMSMILTGSKRDSAASADLPPIVPTFTSANAAGGATTSSGGGGCGGGVKNVKVGSRWISSSKRARKWAWTPFSSSSRTDGAEFCHWQRAGVDYVEYPFARFDIHLDGVSYTAEEYQRYLMSDTWTQSETAELMELARKFELRWPVIYDRWYEKFYYRTDDNVGDGDRDAVAVAAAASPANKMARKIEDLQHRYYEVAAKLAQARISQEAAEEVQSLSKATAAAAAAAASAVATGQQQAGLPASVAAAAAASGGSGGTPNPADPTVTLPPGVDPKTESLLLETAAAWALATVPGSQQPLMVNLGTGSSNKQVFDIHHERKRRHHLDRMWKRSKQEEEEEMVLRKELKEVEAQLRKLKKTGGHIMAAKAASGGMGGGTTMTAQVGGGHVASHLSSAASSLNPSRATSPTPGGGSAAASSAAGGATADFGTAVNLADAPAVLDQSFTSMAPVPMPGYPYLQSGRLVEPATGGDAGLNKSLLTRMDQVLDELHISNRPLPTKRVCDMYDSVRKDILTLVTLQKMVMQKEGQLQAKRVKLSKMGGTLHPPSEDGKVLDEERLLGIPPPAPAPAPTAAKPAKPKPTKKKPPGSAAGGGGGKKLTTAKPAGDESTAATSGPGEATRKKPVKRKRKSEAKSPPPGGASSNKKPAPKAASASSVVNPAAISATIALAAQAAAAGAGLDVTQAANVAASGGASPAASSGSAKKRARKS